MPSAHRTIEIDAPPEQAMAVITDFPSYPSFLPETEKVEVLHEEPSGRVWEARFTVRVIRQLSYTLRLAQEGPLRLSWTLLEGAFQAQEGSWDLTPLDEGRRTRAEYRLSVQLGLFVPGNIVRSLIDHQLPDTLERFKGEIERRAGAGAGGG